MSTLSTLQYSLEQVLDGSSWNDGNDQGLRSARNLVRESMTDAEFVCECIELELQLIKSKRDGRNLEPFIHMPSIRAGLAFGYWPPYGSTGPHEHTAWTVTALLSNALEIHVYDWDASYASGALVQSKIFHARALEAGYISIPTIHDVKNNSSEWSLALHMLSDHDGQRPQGYPNSIFSPQRDVQADGPYHSVNNGRLRRAKVLQLAKLARDRVAMPARLGPSFAPFMVGSNAVRIGTLLGLDRIADPALRRLRRIHPDLKLSVEGAGPTARLWLTGDHHPHLQLDVAAEFADALAFVAEQSEFDVAALPGDLSAADRQLLARAIEDSCLYEATN